MKIVILLILIQQTFGLHYNFLNHNEQLNENRERIKRQIHLNPSLQQNEFDLANKAELNDDSIVFDESFDFNDRDENRWRFISTTPKPRFTTQTANTGIAEKSRLLLCDKACLTTSQYDPVCGDNNVTYFSINRLKCAQKCGTSVNVRHFGACKRFG